MRGLLRRLFPGQRTATEASRAGDRAVPWWMREDHELTPDRIEAARQRLKQKIPPPDRDEETSEGEP